MKNYKMVQQRKYQYVVKNERDEFKFSANEINGIKGSLFIFFILGFLIGLIF